MATVSNSLSTLKREREKTVREREKTVRECKSPGLKFPRIEIYHSSVIQTHPVCGNFLSLD